MALAAFRGVALRPQGSERCGELPGTSRASGRVAQARCWKVYQIARASTVALRVGWLTNLLPCHPEAPLARLARPLALPATKLPPTFARLPMQAEQLVAFCVLARHVLCAHCTGRCAQALASRSYITVAGPSKGDRPWKHSVQSSFSTRCRSTPGTTC